MHRLARYAVAVGVGVALAALVAAVSGTHGLPSFAVPVVYAATTALALAHRETWVELSRREDSSRKLGALGGGVGAFAGNALLQVSVPVGLTGLGLMLFGMTVTVADVSTLEE
jgi:hypothetical protein